MNQQAYREILSMAIKGETDAHAYYRSVADRAKDTTIKTLFAELAGEEAKHRTMLEGFLAKPPASLHFDPSHDYKVADTFETPELTVALKPIDGIMIAIKRELEAMQLYTQLAARSTDAGQKAMFVELASMERGHKAKLEDIYTNMAFPEVW